MWQKGFFAICCLGVLAYCFSAEEAATPPAPSKLNNGSQEKTMKFQFAAVRYQVKNVGRSAAFYSQRLGFEVEQPSPAFAKATSGALTLWLSGPESSGSRAMPDGRQQEPGGWNRIALQVDDLPARIAELKKQGVHFRNDLESGPGGRQIQLEDPDGNPIELFEPAGPR